MVNDTDQQFFIVSQSRRYARTILIDQEVRDRSVIQEIKTIVADLEINEEIKVL